jgi:carbonic anhydrase/acetyltransferase-like protein (isoleucine patch superfamily)
MGCRISSKYLIVVRMVILESAEVEEFSIVVVTEKPAISSGWLSVGIPAKSKRKFVKEEAE